MHLRAEDEERLAIHKKPIVTVLLIEMWDLLRLAEYRRSGTRGKEKNNSESEPRRARTTSIANWSDAARHKLPHHYATDRSKIGSKRCTRNWLRKDKPGRWAIRERGCPIFVGRAPHPETQLSCGGDFLMRQP